MNLEEFLAWCKAQDAETYKVLEQANSEYAAKGNKFENFDQIAAFFNAFFPEFNNQLRPQHIGAIYFLKHFISILKGVSIREDMAGRETDSLNYIRLIAGMNQRDREKAKPPEMKIRASDPTFYSYGDK